jgi:hypothetical protein
MFVLGISSDCLDIALRLKTLLHSVVDHVLQVLQFLGVVKLFFVTKELLRNRDFVFLRYLMVLSCIPAVAAVCPVCHGSASLFGCLGNDPSNCPFYTDIVANTAAIAGSGSAGLLVSRVLPLWVSRLLSKDKLSVVTALAQRSQSGTTAFDLKDKSEYEIRKAVRTGRCPKADAIDHVELEASKIDLSSLTDHAYTKAKDRKEGLLKLAKDLQKITVLVESRQENETNSSALLYLLAMLSERICRDPTKVREDICLPAVDDDDSSQSKAKQMTAALQRPKTLEQMMRLLNMWVLLCHVTSVATCMTLSAFVDEVAFLPIADKHYSWPVAFEIIIQYLVHVEASQGELAIGNVRSRMGGIDAVRVAAEAKAKELYSAAIFRPHGGNPGNVTDVVQEKDISGNKSSKKGCACFNLGNPHGARQLESPRKCKFRHACDKELSEKDANGQWKHCLNSAGTPGHKRGECDNPNKRI